MINSPLVHQGVLIEKLKYIFPRQETFVETKKKSNLKFPSNAYLELDVWIPENKICFEFQDIYHYTPTWNVQMSKEEINKKDEMKLSIVRQHGTTLVTIPCWWNGGIDSLIASIHFERPDLISDNGCSPVALNPPLGFFPSVDIPDVRGIMLASFPMDNNTLSISDNTWWMGEKYDGVRYCWNPLRKQMYSRTGRILTLPKEVESNLPPVFMDSEFWFGRGNFAVTYSLFRSHESIQWDILRIIAFDIYDNDTNELPFEMRYSYLLKNIDNNNPIIVISPRIYCPSNEFLGTVTHYIIDKNGEGVILQKISSFYESGRTSSLLKLKTSAGDQEGVVVARDNDGSVTLKLADGVIFSVSSQDITIPTPSLGDVVTFSFENISRREKPSKVKIYRIRSDIKWCDVVSGSAGVDKKKLNEKSKIAGFTAHPTGHWTKQNMKLFFENFAKNKNLDPYLSSTWYKFSMNDIVQHKGGITIVNKLGGYFKALKYLFPDLIFDRNKFAQKSWADISNRRKFFEDYAQKNGFDANNAENWYSQHRRKIETFKGGSTIFNYYHGNLYKALVDVFPTIGLDPIKFRQYRYHNRENRIKFFENYANDNKFDPLNPENWYLQSREKILAYRGATTLLQYHEGNMKTALLDLFPNIGLDKTKFYRHSYSWSEAENRRKFFEVFARANKFNPLSPDNWYSEQTREKFMSKKGALSILEFHNNSYDQALVDLYPEIGFSNKNI